MLQSKSACGGRILIFLCAGLILWPQTAGAWGIHSLLTQVALSLLPEWQRKAIGKEADNLVRRYCIFPDVVRDADAKPYVLPFPKEAEVSHHIPGTLAQQRLMFDAYLPRVVELLKAGNTVEALRLFGSLMHFIEDSSAPCHMRYGETRVPNDAPPMLQIDFFKRFLPLPDKVDQEMLHARIDSCAVTEAQLREAVGQHKPRLLGHSVEELAFQLLEEHVQMNARASKRLFPMLQALADDDEPRFIALGAQAAAEGTALSADVLYSVLCIAQSRFDAPPPATVSMADRTPAESSPFAWGDKNHQGRLLYNASGAIHSNMSEPAKLGRHPLSLLMPDGAVREFAKGYGVGGRTFYTFLLPRGVFRTFKVYVGNDAALGKQSVTTFEILLDGKPAAASPKFKGAVPCAELNVPLGDAQSVTLRCQGEGPASTAHGVWAEPVLIR